MTRRRVRLHAHAGRHPVDGAGDPDAGQRHRRGPQAQRAPTPSSRRAARAESDRQRRRRSAPGRSRRSVNRCSCGSADGYPDRADYWAGGVLQRRNIAVSLANLGTTGEMTPDISRFNAVNTPDGVVAAINKALFGGEMPDRLKGQLLTYLQVQPTPSVTRVRETIALALSSSTFQWI
ncbi:MAG: DUF1800 family protein [Gemmatimonadetes bacterium]|nr:DUF1800 family protein [Gemmatimonadota bacterium]